METGILLDAICTLAGSGPASASADQAFTHREERKKEEEEVITSYDNELHWQKFRGSRIAFVSAAPAV